MNETLTKSILEPFKFTLENIVKTIPLVIGLFIFCGSLNLSIYFNVFGISIFNYLDTTEILTSFLNLVHSIVLIFCAIAAYILFLQLINRARGKSITKEKPATISVIGFNKEINSKPQSVGELLMIFIFISSIMCILFMTNSYGLNFHSFMVTYVTYIFCLFLGFYIISSFFVFDFLIKNKRVGLPITILYIILFFISFSIIESADRVDSTLRAKEFHSVIYRESDTLITNEKYLYVGRTNKYVFLYDVNKKRADVIPESTIKKLEFTYP